MSSPSITITPENPLMDDLLEIKVTGLRPHQEVTLVARVTETQFRFISYAHYIADTSGHVTTADMTSVCGSYKGVQQMALFTTLIPEANQRRGLRLVKRDVTTPINTRIYVYDGHFDATEPGEMEKRQYLATSTVHRWYKAHGVKRIEVREGRLIGTFFLPEGEGPFPGVLDMFGTIGGTVEHRSALFASRGIASLALCYFTPETGIVQDLEYFESAVEWILSQPRVIKTGVATLGVSKGADMAMLTAVVCPKVKAVIPLNGTSFNGGLEHTYKGETFPFADFFQDYFFPEHGQDIEFGKHFHLHPKEDYSNATIPVERSSAKYLVINGEDDKNSLPWAQIDIPLRLARYGKQHQCRTLLYPGAGHILEPPYSPLCERSYQPAFGAVTVWGGEPYSHAKAQEDSWRQIQDFIRTTLCESESKDVSTRQQNKSSKL